MGSTEETPRESLERFAREREIRRLIELQQVAIANLVDIDAYCKSLGESELKLIKECRDLVRDGFTSKRS